MDYQKFYTMLFQFVEKRDFKEINLERGILSEYVQPILFPKKFTIIYDKKLYPEFKHYVLSNTKKFVENPGLFFSILKELKGLFLPKEYKDLKILFKCEFALTFDENSEKMAKLKFVNQSFSEQTASDQDARVKDVNEFISLLCPVDESLLKANIKQFMKAHRFTIKEKKDNFNAFYRSTDKMPFESFVSRRFEFFFENLKLFPYQNLGPLVEKAVSTLLRFKLIREEKKDLFLHNRGKYEREYDEKLRMIQRGGEIIKEEVEKLKISKEDKKKTLLGFYKLGEILKEFDFLKMGLKEAPNFIYFGSFKSGFALKASDIDTTLITNSAFDERELLRPILDYLQEYRIQKGAKFELEDRVKDNIRIPIIKYKEGKEGDDFKADIAVNNVLGVANSCLLKVYSRIDKRCKRLGLLLKNWAKQWKITSEDSMSSYALILQMIYFLQIKKILPSLQKIAKETLKSDERAMIKVKRIVKDGGKEEFSTDLSFENDIEKIHQYMKNKNFPKNKQNILELLLEFFHFYSDKGAFKNYKMKVNITAGEPRFVNILGKDYERRERQFMFSIKDPFDKEHNPGDRVKKIEKVKELNYHIDSTIQNLESTDYEERRYSRFFRTEKRDNKCI